MDKIMRLSMVFDRVWRKIIFADIYFELSSSTWTDRKSLSWASCLVEAEREASSTETDDQYKEIRGAEHELFASERILSSSLRNVKRMLVTAFAARAVRFS